VLDHTGDIAYIIAIHTKSACNPNFNDFPWGVQVNGKIIDITKNVKAYYIYYFLEVFLRPKHRDY
jgi:hypothetical protein